MWASVLGYASLVVLVPAAVLGARNLPRRGVPLLPLLGPLAVGLLEVGAFYGNPPFRISGEASLVVLAAVGFVGHLPKGASNGGGQSQPRPLRLMALRRRGRRSAPLAPESG